MDGWTTKSGKKFGVKFVVEPWGHAFVGVGPKKTGLRSKPKLRLSSAAKQIR